MSRHQDYRNYDYENDLGEYDGEGEEDEMSPEDRALLALSVEEAKQRLGEDVKNVPGDSIAEAVYHYYYDVDKAVAYLVKTFINPPPPPAAAKQAKQTKAKAKQDSHDGKHLLCFCCCLVGNTSSEHESGQGSRLDAACLSPANRGSQSLGSCDVSRHLTPRTAKLSYASFFEDMPWLGVPQSRQAIFVAPLLPRGGLLGGASAAPKMSKLQALAAQRKRKAEEAKKAKEGGVVENKQPQVMAKADEHPSKSAKVVLRAGRRPRTPTEEAEAPRPPAADSVPMEGVCGPGEAAVQEQQREVAQIAEPSAFAQVMFGPKKRKRRISDVGDEGFLAVPSLARAPAAAFEAFSLPSPDDVVLQAQAKGWRKGQAAAN